MKQYSMKLESTDNKILEAKKMGARFAIGFDESTSVRNRR